MDIIPTSHPDVQIIRPHWFKDARGAFSEVYSRRTWAAYGLTADFCQDNHAFSHQAGTVRGLHFQRPPFAQAKLVWVVRGSILDVAVDIRLGSPYYGHWVVCELSADNRQQLFIPVGFAHGYCTVEPDTEVVYKVDNYYDPESEGGLLWNDPALAIPWPPVADIETVIDRDRTWPGLAGLRSAFTFG